MKKFVFMFLTAFVASGCLPYNRHYDETNARTVQTRVSAYSTTQSDCERWGRTLEKCDRVAGQYYKGHKRNHALKACMSANGFSGYKSDYCGSSNIF